MAQNMETKMKQLLVVMAMLCIGASSASAQMEAAPSTAARSGSGVSIPLGSTELRTPGLSPDGAEFPLPGTQFGSSAMAGTDYGAGLAAADTPSLGLGNSGPVNRLITNYGTGGMQLPPGSPPGSLR
jgi:hypothetical protein